MVFALNFYLKDDWKPWIIVDSNALISSAESLTIIKNKYKVLTHKLIIEVRNGKILHSLVPNKLAYIIFLISAYGAYYVCLHTSMGSMWWN